MKDDTYRQLQKQLDQYSMGFPETKSGIEIKILKYLFSDTDAKMFVSMTPMLETPEAVAARIDRPVTEVATHLDDMAEKGLLFRVKKQDTSRYGAIPFVHGLFEFQVKNLNPDFSKMVEQYFDEAFDKAMQVSADHFLRTIPVQQSIDAEHHVASYDDAVELLKSKNRIVVTECICRKRTQTVDQGCGKVMEACFMFGSMGQYYLDRNLGREVTLEEATNILTECQKAGLVTQPATAQNPAGMCNCCGDCCCVLGALNKLPNPAEAIISNYRVIVDSEECTGCETCVDRCQMNAMSLNDEDVIEINEKRCIGCGLCVTTCPTEALTLVPKPEADIRVPPSNMMEQMMGMARKRGVI